MVALGRSIHFALCCGRMSAKNQAWSSSRRACISLAAWALLVRWAAARPSFEADDGFVGAAEFGEGLGGHLVGGDVVGVVLR